MKTAEQPEEAIGQQGIMPRGSERRVAKRHACDGFAEVLVPARGFLFRGEIVDLSESGCYIKTRARLNLDRGTQAELRFTVNDNRFSISAQVAEVRPGTGAGFQFYDVTPDILNHLQEIIDELDAREAGAPEQPATGSR